MIVCQCRAVSDRLVRGAVAEGCTSLRSVAAATGAGTVCGTCVPTLRDLVCGGCPSLVTELACDDRIEVAAGGAVGQIQLAAPAPVAG